MLVCLYNFLHVFMRSKVQQVFCTLPVTTRRVGYLCASQRGCAKSLQVCHLPSPAKVPRIVTTPKAIQRLRTAIIFQDLSAALHCTVLCCAALYWNIKWDTERQWDWRQMKSSKSPYQTSWLSPTTAVTIRGSDYTPAESTKPGLPVTLQAPTIIIIIIIR